MGEFLSSDELLRKDTAKITNKKEDGVLPGSSCYKQRAEMEMKKEQAAKLKQNSKQAYFGEGYKVYQTKVLNPINQQYGGHKINPLNANFHHPASGNDNDKLLSAM